MKYLKETEVVKIKNLVINFPNHANISFGEGEEINEGL